MDPRGRKPSPTLALTGWSNSEPHRMSTAMAWRRGIPASFWLEDYPHAELWDSEYYVAGVRTVVIDRLGPRRPDVYDRHEAKACTNLSVGGLPILTRVADARIATAQLEADESLDFDACPSYLLPMSARTNWTLNSLSTTRTIEISAGRTVIAFGPADPFAKNPLVCLWDRQGTISLRFSDQGYLHQEVQLAPPVPGSRRADVLARPCLRRASAHRPRAPREWHRVSPTCNRLRTSLLGCRLARWWRQQSCRQIASARRTRASKGHLAPGMALVRGGARYRDSAPYVLAT